MDSGSKLRKLIASYGDKEEFLRAAEEIIEEEEQKRNNLLARDLRNMLYHPNNHIHTVAHIHKIPALLTIDDISVARLEQAYASRNRQFLIELAHNTHLTALMKLVGTIYIKEFQTHMLFWTFLLFFNPKIKKLF